MPPKKLKDLSSAPVYGMAHEEQVRLLSDALLREYMHRRGYLATLKAFDEENPRDGETISSRALMADLMALDHGEQQRLKAEGIETIMEVLCDLRVEKRLSVEQLSAEATAPLPAAPTEEELAALEREVEARRAQAAAATNAASVSSTGHRHKRKSSKSADTRRKAEDKEKRRHKKDRKRPHEKASLEGGDSADPFSMAKTEDGITLDDLLGSSGSSSEDQEARSVGSASSDEGAAAAHKGATGMRSKEKGNAAASPSWLDDGNGAHEKRSASSGGAVNTKQGAYTHTNSKGDTNHDDGAAEDGEDDDSIVPGGGVDGGAPLPVKQAQAVCELVFGRAARLPPVSFLQQGFAFDDNGLDYALVQWRRGPGAVLAVVQSLVITYMYEKEVYVNVKTRQLDCLRRALATILFRAQPNPSSIVLVNGQLHAKHPQRHFADRMFPTDEADAAFHAWGDFESLEEVEDMLHEFLPEEGEQWLAPKGSGLWCFLLSTCLSRGVDTVAKDMGLSTDGSLTDPSTGDGRRELLHFMLTGRATTTPQPRGISQPSGLLDGDARRRSTDDDTDGGDGGLSSSSSSTPAAFLNPSFPSWVIHHRGHYSNLFMKRDTRKTFLQKKQLSGTASAELTYWDALTEDDAYDLVIEVASLGKAKEAAAAAAASFVTAALQTVPEWAKAVTDWKGEKPPK